MKRLLLIALLCVAGLSVEAASWQAPSTAVSQLQAQHKPQLVLFYKPQCPYCQKVLSYLQQIHKSVPLRDVTNDPQAGDELKRVGGKMQVPCLFINGKPLYESHDIVKWLEAHKDDLDPAR